LEPIMSSKTFTSGRIRKAEHDASAGRLDLHSRVRQLIL